MALTDMFVRQAKATGKDYTIPDFDGLSLAVSNSGTKSWHFRYTWLGQQKRMSLGTYPEITLREARERRDNARALVAKGINPRLHREKERQAVSLAAEYTFEAVYEKWLAHRSLKLKEGRQSTLVQIRRAFDKDVLPALRKRSIYEINRADLLEVVGRIERRKALSVAEKVRTWFNQLFRYALVIVPGLERNPASDLDVVALPQPPVRHNPFLRMEELPAFLRTLRKYPGRQQTQLGIRLLLLTGVRTGELRRAEPGQFLLDDGLWIIEPARGRLRRLSVRRFGLGLAGGIFRCRQLAFVQVDRFLQGVMFAFEPLVFGLLFLGAAKCEQGWPEQDQADAHENLVVAGGFVQSAGKLAYPLRDALAFASELFAVVAPVLHRGNVLGGEVLR